jgi:transposase
MSGAFSADLRGWVLDAVEAGSSVRRAAVRFGVGVSTAIRWTRRWRETGERTARKQGHPIRSKLDAHNAYLLGLIEQTVDITLDEMCHRRNEHNLHIIKSFPCGSALQWRKGEPSVLSSAN